MDIIIIHILGSILPWIHSGYYPYSWFYPNLNTQWILSIFWDHIQPWIHSGYYPCSGFYLNPGYTVDIIHVLCSILTLDTQWISRNFCASSVDAIVFLCCFCAWIQNGYNPISGPYLCLDTKWISSKLCALSVLEYKVDIIQFLFLDVKYRYHAIYVLTLC